MCSRSAEECNGWEVYPQNLRLTAIDVDAPRSNRRIHQLSKELFVADHESEFSYLGMSAQRLGMHPQYLVIFCGN
jgi:hypothetical protein